MNNIEKELIELQEIKAIIDDLFTSIELSEDENAETRLNNMETYLRRLARYKGR